MSLSFISTLAQEESHTKSEIMNASIEMRFSRGIFLTPELLGYDKDSEGNLIVNQEEALTVRLIFFMFLYGYGCTQIAETLMELGRLTKPGNTKWTAGTVMLNFAGFTAQLWRHTHEQIQNVAQFFACKVICANNQRIIKIHCLQLRKVHIIRVPAEITQRHRHLL